jgi:16S rRNA (cytosine1402-N4)-methyltransferase
VTVLLDEAVSALRPIAGGTYVDATFGGGGHSSLLLSWRPPVARVIAIDADRDAESRARTLATRSGDDGRLTFARQNFRDLASILDDLDINQVDGVLFDLGLSSFQLDESARGFSFRADAPLDMRFDQGSGVPASTIVNSLAESDLAEILWRLGEERQSRRIAAAVARARERSPIRTTQELAAIIENAVGGRRGAAIHPATRSFQALRIHVNEELAALSNALLAATGALAPGGRLVVISFHSLENRIVKRFIEAEARTCVCPPDQPVCTCDTIPRLTRIGRPVRPGQPEIDDNPRSRSAIMRVAERLDHTGAVVGQGSRQ